MGDDILTGMMTKDKQPMWTKVIEFVFYIAGASLLISADYQAEIVWEAPLGVILLIWSNNIKLVFRKSLPDTEK